MKHAFYITSLIQSTKLKLIDYILTSQFNQAEALINRNQSQCDYG